MKGGVIMKSLNENKDLWTNMKVEALEDREEYVYAQMIDLCCFEMCCDWCCVRIRVD